MATVFPAPYFKINSLPQPSGGQGRDLLGPIAETSATIRPKIGGKRRTHKRHASRKITKRSRKQKGGFLPSIGEAFATVAAKYVTPIALYGIFRFMNRKTRKVSRRR
jgi:hypothetical protein